MGGAFGPGTRGQGRSNSPRDPAPGPHPGKAAPGTRVRAAAPSARPAEAVGGRQGRGPLHSALEADGGPRGPRPGHSGPPGSGVAAAWSLLTFSSTQLTMMDGYLRLSQRKKAGTPIAAAQVEVAALPADGRNPRDKQPRALALPPTCVRRPEVRSRRRRRGSWEGGSDGAGPSRTRGRRCPRSSRLQASYRGIPASRRHPVWSPPPSRFTVESKHLHALVIFFFLMSPGFMPQYLSGLSTICIFKYFAPMMAGLHNALKNSYKM